MASRKLTWRAEYQGGGGTSWEYAKTRKGHFILTLSVGGVPDAVIAGADDEVVLAYYPTFYGDDAWEEPLWEKVYSSPAVAKSAAARMKGV